MYSLYYPTCWLHGLVQYPSDLLRTRKIISKAHITSLARLLAFHPADRQIPFKTLIILCMRVLALWPDVCHNSRADIVYSDIVRTRIKCRIGAPRDCAFRAESYGGCQHESKIGIGKWYLHTQQPACRSVYPSVQFPRSWRIINEHPLSDMHPVSSAFNYWYCVLWFVMDVLMELYKPTRLPL